MEYEYSEQFSGLLEGLKAPGFPYDNAGFCLRQKGWCDPLHQHSAFEITLVTNGTASVTFDDKEHFLSQGMISLIPPGYPHIQATKGGHRRLGFSLMLDNEAPIIQLLYNCFSTPFIAYIPELLEFVLELEEHFQLKTLASIHKIRNILECIVLRCIDQVKKQDKNQSFYEKLIEYFKCNISKKINMKDLTNEFFMSQTLIECMVHKEYGCGAIHLFIKLKLDHSRKLLLDTNIPINEIANHLGFEDQSYFSRIFKKQTGLSPRDYRDKKYL